MDKNPQLTTPLLALWRALTGASSASARFSFPGFHALLGELGVGSYSYDLTTGVLRVCAASRAVGDVLLPSARKINPEFPLASPRWTGSADAAALEGVVGVLRERRMAFAEAIKMLIAAGVKELEGRVSSGRISFAGSDGEGIWHDFDNVEKDLAGNLEEMSLDEEALDGDKENKPCVAVRESCWVKEREDEGEKSWEGVPLALRLASQPCETLPVEEASSAYVDLPVEFCWGEDELYD